MSDIISQEAVFQLLNRNTGVRSGTFVDTFSGAADKLKELMDDERQESEYVIVVAEIQPNGDYTISNRPLLTVKDYIQLVEGMRHV